MISKACLLYVFSVKKKTTTTTITTTKTYSAKNTTRKDSKGLENVVTPNGQLQKYSDVLLL